MNYGLCIYFDYLHPERKTEKKEKVQERKTEKQRNGAGKGHWATPEKENGEEGKRKRGLGLLHQTWY